MQSSDGPLIQINVRVPAAVRDALREAAALHQTSFSGEVARRLSDSLRDERLGEIVFGSRATYQLLSEFSRILMALEITHKKSWQQDPAIVLAAMDVLRRAFEVYPVIRRGGWPEGFDPQKAIDYGALVFVSSLLEAEQGLDAAVNEDAPQR
jgi:hypothetical protein